MDAADPPPSNPTPAAAPSAAAWLEAFAARLGRPAPTPAEAEALLALAAVAAHASERLAAPLACWAVGAAGLAPDAALALAREVTAGLGADGA